MRTCLRYFCANTEMAPSRIFKEGSEGMKSLPTKNDSTIQSSTTRSKSSSTATPTLSFFSFYFCLSLCVTQHTTHTHTTHTHTLSLSLYIYMSFLFFFLPGLGGAGEVERLGDSSEEGTSRDLTSVGATSVAITGSSRGEEVGAAPSIEGSEGDLGSFSSPAPPFAFALLEEAGGLKSNSRARYARSTPKFTMSNFSKAPGRRGVDLRPGGGIASRRMWNCGSCVPSPSRIRSASPPYMQCDRFGL